MMASDLHQSLKRSFDESAGVVADFFSRSDILDLTVQFVDRLVSVFDSGHKVLIAGNGGSACDAMHFAEEFTGRYRKDRQALPVISLTDSSQITCVGNDFGFDHIFSRGVEAYGQPGDLFVGLSTSGNSQNIINAFSAAKEREMTCISLLGRDGGALKDQADISFIVPAQTSDRIQEVHMALLHIVIEGVERRLFPELYA